MSLINDMLRNLEAKRPDDLARQNLQREIRSLPAGKPGRGGLLRGFLLLGLPLVGVGAAFLYANGQLLPLLGMETAPAKVVAPTPPAPVAPPVPPVAPVPVAPVPVAEATLPPAAPAEIQPPLIAENLRMAQGLAAPPTPVAPVLAVPDPLPPPAPAKKEAESAKATAAGTAAAPVPSGPVKIEKSLVAATPRDRAEVEYHKAESALAAGRSGEALESLRAALKLDAGHVQVRQALLRQLLDMRKTEEAISVLHDGLELQPMQIGWAISLARLQMEQGDLQAADKTLARSQAYAENNADYAGFQGHLKSRLNAHRQAAAHYQRATRLAPNEGRWWLGLGLALEADGRAGEAKDALRKALASSTLSPELAAVAEQHLR
jgi:MSHA biogenesis protein MshN